MTTPVRWIRDRAGSGGVVVCGLGLGVVLAGGCGKPEEPPPPPPKQTYTPPPPEPIEVAGLLQSMGVDARVEFAGSEAPVDRSLAEAVIYLADAFARGDDGALSGMLDMPGQLLLQRLVNTEQWVEATERIEAVRVVSLDSISKGSESPEQTTVLLAVQDRDGAYILGWSGKRVFDEWVFSATPSTGEERPRASAWDGMGPMAGGGFGGGGDGELRGLIAKGMASPEDLSLEELLRLKELLEKMEVVPPGAMDLIEREISRREKRAPEGGRPGVDDGGGDAPRDRGRPGGPG